MLHEAVYYYRVRSGVKQKKGPPRGPIVREWRFNKKKMSVKGGVVVVVLYDDKDAALSAGCAVCSMSDEFSYETGRTLARSRAYSALEQAIGEMAKVIPHENPAIVSIVDNAVEGAMRRWQL